MNIEIEEKLGPALSGAIANLEGPGRARISAAMGTEVRLLLVKHFTELAGSRHATANRLGANPTGFLSQLAENFDQVSTVEVDEDGVSISMRHPAIARALRDITITPKSGRFLTIPLNAAAYGRRVGEFDQFILVKPRGSGGGEKPEARTRKPVDNTIPAFLLLPSVTQKRDPSLLPTMEEINTAAAEGARNELRAMLQESGF